jgi:hypothetical protein
MPARVTATNIETPAGDGGCCTKGSKKLRNLNSGRRIAIRSSGEGLVPFVCRLAGTLSMGRPITDRRTGSMGDLCDSLDEQRESRGARGSRLLRWQKDRAAKLITRACPRVIWQSQRCVISQGEARVWPAWDRRPTTGPGPGAQTSTPWSLRPLCTEARRTVAIGTSLMTSVGPALTYGAPRGIGNAPLCRSLWRMTSPDRSGHPMLVAA